MIRDYVVTFTLTGEQWMSSNHRMHWAAKGKRTRMIRAIAKQQAVKIYRGEPIGLAHIVAEISYPTARRADPANSYPTIKAAVDGLVDAGWFTDDDAKHVIGPDMRLGAKTGIAGLYRVRITATPINALRRDRNGAGVELPTSELQTQPSPGSATIPGITGDDRR